MCGSVDWTGLDWIGMDWNGYARLDWTERHITLIIEPKNPNTPYRVLATPRSNKRYEPPRLALESRMASKSFYMYVGNLSDYGPGLLWGRTRARGEKEKGPRT